MARSGRESSTKAVRLVPAVSIRPLEPPKVSDVVKITNERELLLMARALSARTADDPAFSVMLLANPVLALKAYGIELSPGIADHVLRALRHPKALGERRAALEASLEKTLGEPARPTDPQWLARLVFETRGLKPREVGDLQPAYSPEVFDKARKVLDARRPARTDRYPEVRRLKNFQRLAAAPVKPSVRRLDLSAPLPALKEGGKPVANLSLEEAWFYKDDPVVAEAVELGQIVRRALPFRTPEEFRKLQSGEMTDVFRAFVSRVTIKGAKDTPS